MVYENKKCWPLHIRTLVKDTIGLKHVWENQGSKHPKKQISSIIGNLKHIFEFQWLNTLNKVTVPGKPGNKLRTYALFKKTFEYENYLNFHPDYKKRKFITKLRISAHRLEIEIGRYKNKASVQSKNRNCQHCDLKVTEDEKHVLMECPKYSDDRSIMFNQLYCIFHSFENYDDNEKFEM